MISTPVPESTARCLDLSVIIVNWNAWHLLEGLLRGLAAPSSSLRTEIWVVDNASTEETGRLIRSSFPDVRFIANTANVGFAAANNQAARQASGRYLLLLNPDTQVLPRGIDALVEYADVNPKIGALGPRIVNPDGSRQRSCWRNYPGITMALIDALYLWRISWLPLANWSEYRAEELVAPCPVDHLLGACMLVRREAWEDVGPFDESYFLYLEETDWCWRARHMGWQIVYDPQVTIMHQGQQSAHQLPAKNLPLFYGSYCRFYRKHHGAAFRIAALKSVIALAALVRIGLWRYRTRRAPDMDSAQHARAMVGGYRQVLRELPSF